MNVRHTFAFAAFTFSLCGPVLAADVSQDAIDACIDTLRAAQGGGGYVLGTEFSEANSLVTLRDGGGMNWRCLVGNDGSSAEIEPLAAGASSMSVSGDGHFTVDVSSALNVHSAPSTAAPVIAKLGRGFIVENLGCGENGGREWCKIHEGDHTGWAAREFLVPSETAHRRPTIEHAVDSIKVMLNPAEGLSGTLMPDT